MAGKDRKEREARERARAYEARLSAHRTQVRRRTRDNVVAGVVGGLLVVGLAGVQTAYFTLGPGASAASVQSTPSPAATDVIPGPLTPATP